MFSSTYKTVCSKFKYQQFKPFFIILKHVRLGYFFIPLLFIRSKEDNKNNAQLVKTKHNETINYQIIYYICFLKTLLIGK